MDAIIRISCIFLSFYMSNGQLLHPTIVFPPSELLNDTATHNTDSAKLALRYGFHRTSECESYEKAFLCIQKCVDRGYDIAYSDKYCFCTCYVNKQKAKYTPEHYLDRTRWKLGTPKTKKPAWIQKLADDAQKSSIESIHVIKKPGTTPYNDTVLSDEPDTISAQNITISNNTTNAMDRQIVSNDTNVYSPIVTDTTNVSIQNESSAASTTGSPISGVTNVTDSQSDVNATDSQNINDTKNVTDNLNANGVPNSTVSVVTNVTNAQTNNTET
ncbi:uncharacterized protein LOC120637101 isoform X1 [Pararge aegeria]|uniref:uncharacterized protein LOC120637101 isoform X1 n=1 Tax=Pararge aegeria TaxID=116150 RepID=UPI0019D16385|nr:uncharacterized protein LOC120637101 isoform X1 [Pararge aegeria]